MKTFRLLAVLSALLAPVALAGPGGPGGPGLEGGFDHPQMRMLLKAANLSDDQRTQVHQILKQVHEQIRPLLRQERDLHEQLGDKLAGAGPVQLLDLAPLRQQIRDLRSQIDDQMLGGMLKVRALLRPDQLQNVAAAHEHFKSLRTEMDSMMEPPLDGHDPEGH